jgi:hypothetical protein
LHARRARPERLELFRVERLRLHLEPDAIVPKMLRDQHSSASITARS